MCMSKMHQAAHTIVLLMTSPPMSWNGVRQKKKTISAFVSLPGIFIFIFFPPTWKKYPCQDPSSVEYSAGSLMIQPQESVKIEDSEFLFSCVTWQFISVCTGWPCFLIGSQVLYMRPFTFKPLVAGEVHGIGWLPVGLLGAHAARQGVAEAMCNTCICGATNRVPIGGSCNPVIPISKPV